MSIPTDTAPPAGQRHIRIGDVQQIIAQHRGKPRSQVPFEVRALDWLMQQFTRKAGEADALLMANMRLTYLCEQYRVMAANSIVNVADVADFLRKIADREIAAWKAVPEP